MRVLAWATGVIVLGALVFALAVTTARSRADADWNEAVAAWRARPGYVQPEHEEAAESHGLGWREVRWFTLFESTDPSTRDHANLRLKRRGLAHRIEVNTWPDVSEDQMAELRATLGHLDLVWERR